MLYEVLRRLVAPLEQGQLLTSGTYRRQRRVSPGRYRAEGDEAEDKEQAKNKPPCTFCHKDIQTLITYHDERRLLMSDEIGRPYRVPDSHNLLPYAQQAERSETAGPGKILLSETYVISE